MGKNDTSFKPGQSGNPNGRPVKGFSFTEAARELIGEEPDKKKLLIKKLFDSALSGNIRAIELLWAYMDGKPVQTTNLNTSESPAEKVKKTIELIQKARKDGLLSSGSSGDVQDKGGETLSNDRGPVPDIQADPRSEDN